MILAFLSQHPPRFVECAPELSPPAETQDADAPKSAAVPSGVMEAARNAPPFLLSPEHGQGLRGAILRRDRGGVPSVGPLSDEVQVSTGEAA